MFEKVILKSSDSGAAITAGELAEALLYYQNVHLVLDYGSVMGLVRQIGMPNLLTTLNRPNVSAIYTEQMLTVLPQTINNRQYFSFEAIRICGSELVGQLHSAKRRFTFMLEDKCNIPRKRAMLYQERFRKLAPFKRITDDSFIEGGLIRAAHEELADKNLVKDAIKVSLKHSVGLQHIPEHFEYRVFLEENRFTVDTDLDFSALSKVYSSRWGGSLSVVNPLLDFFIFKSDLAFAAHYGSEIYTSHRTSDLIDLKCKGLLRRINLDKTNINSFSRTVTQNAPKLRDVINSGERTYDEFLVLLDKAEKFKKWIGNKSPEQELISEYLKDISSEPTISKLPSKLIRYFFTTAIGMIEPITGNALSLTDTFLVEKMLGGWRPNRFVTENLSPFVDVE